MASLTLRIPKGSPLTNAELDANFSALNNDVLSRLLASSNLSDLTNSGTARANLGLGNVENKSSATIRGELTSDNVTTALGFTPQTALVSGTSIRTVNGQSVLGSGNIQIDGGVTSFNTRTGAVTLGSGDVTTALGFTPANKAGDTFTGNLQVANGTDSRINLQVSGVTEGILTASSTNVRLSSANAIPVTIGTNGVTRLTFTGTGFITTGASEYVGIGAQAGTNNALRIARNLENGTSAYAVLNDGTFQSGVTVNGAGFRSVARTAAASFTMASLHHYQAVQATLGAGSAITTQAGFVADSSLTSATNNYGFQGSIAAGTGRFNLYMDGTAANFLAGATTFSAALTLNAGMANGVAYLNGSKVLTTGNALTFNGTNLGLGTAVPIVKFDIVSNNNTSLASVLRVNSNNVAVSTSLAYDGLVGSGQLTVQAGTSSALIFGANASEQMRLTSMGLGIGTSSPAYRLDVVDTGGNSFRFTRDTTQLGAFISGGTPFFGALSNHPIAFVTNSTERMHLDTSGNLGLGVTPSAWTNSFGVIQGLGGWSISHNGANSNSVDFLSNAYRSGGANTYLYAASANATRYQQLAGSHAWHTAPSGTAGNAISFTRAMTLDASGNLLLGQTSSTDSSFRLQVTGAGGSINAGLGTNANALRFSNVNTANVEWAIGTSSPGLESAGNFFSFTQLSGGFWAERARITSAGDLCVGRTSGGGRINSQANTNNFMMEFFNQAGGSVGSITTNGAITVYNTTSDYRLKTVVGAVTGSGERIDALEPIEYTWKLDGSHTRGFLAHKFQEVYAGSVSGEKDAVDANGEPIYQRMQASTSEVIADLVAEIQSLRKRLAAAGI